MISSAKLFSLLSTIFLPPFFCERASQSMKLMYTCNCWLLLLHHSKCNLFYITDLLIITKCIFVCAKQEGNLFFVCVINNVRKKLSWLECSIALLPQTKEIWEEKNIIMPSSKRRKKHENCHHKDCEKMASMKRDITHK